VIKKENLSRSVKRNNSKTCTKVSTSNANELNNGEVGAIFTDNFESSV